MAFVDRAPFEVLERLHVSVVFIIGRPAAGKTTVACQLTALAKERCPLIRIAAIDEYDILRNCAKTLNPADVKWDTNGEFELIDRRFLSTTAALLESAVLSCATSHDLTLCELARSEYTSLFDGFSARIRRAMTILYVNAPIQVCRARNDRRLRHRRSGHYVPDSVMTTHYTHDDFDELSRRYRKVLHLIENSRDNKLNVVHSVRGYLDSVGGLTGAFG